ncbi:PREDICTED: neurofilament heavy polypeptide-like [Branchiostoma belcheri]|uniref:Neurofilament heavy polypeptide-like n=1 Tax=Branchiostoma belcheri TaxID=7741 RepID=A0A6P4YVV6_BRABE|nr:PREDICTED: neurofilament heavy polypeptide-like [Branchiostoma belcheri]
MNESLFSPVNDENFVVKEPEKTAKPPVHVLTAQPLGTRSILKPSQKDNIPTSPAEKESKHVQFITPARKPASRRQPASDPWEALRYLDEEERWVDRVQVLTKQDHQDYLKYAQEFLDQILDGIFKSSEEEGPIPKFVSEPSEGDKVTSKESEEEDLSEEFSTSPTGDEFLTPPEEEDLLFEFDPLTSKSDSGSDREFERLEAEALDQELETPVLSSDSEAEATVPDIPPEIPEEEPAVPLQKDEPALEECISPPAQVKQPEKAEEQSSEPIEEVNPEAEEESVTPVLAQDLAVEQASIQEPEEETPAKQEELEEVVADSTSTSEVASPEDENLSIEPTDTKSESTPADSDSAEDEEVEPTVEVASSEEDVEVTPTAEVDNSKENISAVIEAEPVDTAEDKAAEEVKAVEEQSEPPVIHTEPEQVNAAAADTNTDIEEKPTAEIVKAAEEISQAESAAVSTEAEEEEDKSTVADNIAKEVEETSEVSSAEEEAEASEGQDQPVIEGSASEVEAEPAVIQTPEPETKPESEEDTTENTEERPIPR